MLSHKPKNRQYLVDEAWSVQGRTGTNVIAGTGISGSDITENLPKFRPGLI
jgi:hypothetical protein